MKTPDEILNDLWLLNGSPVVQDIPPDNWREIALMAMKEFGRQSWALAVNYNEWLQSLYLNQIAKESQERGEYDDRPKECEHKNSFPSYRSDTAFLREKSRRYCPDCKKYIE